MNKNVQIPEQCKTCLHKGTGCSSRLQLRIAWNTLKSDLARNLYLMPTEMTTVANVMLKSSRKNRTRRTANNEQNIL